jgi:hypothetical protein
MADVDPELEAFIPLFPPAELTDPATARKNLAALAACFAVRRPGAGRRLRGIDG